MRSKKDVPSAMDGQPPVLNWIGHGVAAPTGMRSEPALSERSQSRVGFGWAVVACLLATGLALPFRSALDPANMVMLYLLAVVIIAARFGRGPGILTSVLSVLVFDFFLIRPYQSFTVADAQYLLTFGVMLLVALVISSLAANLRQQAQIAFYRERRTHALFELSQALAGALTQDQIIEIAIRHIANMYRASAALLMPDEQGRLQLRTDGNDNAMPVPPVVLHSAQAVYDSQQTVPVDDAIKISGQWLYLPLRAPSHFRGILAVMSDSSGRVLLSEQQRILQTCAAQIALALERVHYVNVAKEALLSVESERLRNSLLSTISHDIRTPLTAIVGLASTLSTLKTLPDKTREELTGAIQEEALRMSSLIANLLEMAKFQAAGVRLNRQWQILEEVVGSALSQMSRPLSGRVIDLVLEPNLPLLNFDAILIERVLCNLLDNAAKYSIPATAIRIVARIEAEELQMSVEDSGMDIPDELKEAIFSKFTRGNPESAQTGAGLGLSICRSIINAHGGRIWVDDSFRSGARFVFTLPLGSPPAIEEPAECLELSRAGTAT